MRTKEEIIDHLDYSLSNIQSKELKFAWIKLVNDTIFILIEILIDFRDIYRSK